MATDEPDIAYEELSADAQATALLLVCLVHYVSHSELYDRGEAMVWTTADGRPITRKGLKSGVAALKHADWLTYHHGMLQLKPGLRFALVPELKATGSFDHAISYCNDRLARSRQGWLHSMYPERDRERLFYLTYLKQDAQAIAKVYAKYKKQTPTLRLDWLIQPYVHCLPDLYIRDAILPYLRHIITILPDLEMVRDWLESFTERSHPESFGRSREVLSDLAFLSGDTTPRLGGDGHGNQAYTSFLNGDHEAARRVFAEDILMATGSPQKKSHCLPGLAGMLSIMTCLASDDPGDWKLAGTRAMAGIRDAGRGYQKEVFELIRSYAKSLADPSLSQDIYLPMHSGSMESIDGLWISLIARWLGKTCPEDETLFGLIETFRNRGYHWVVGQLEYLKDGMSPTLAGLNLPPLLRVRQPEAEWQRQLKALKQLSEKWQQVQAAQDSPHGTSAILCWHVRYSEWWDDAEFDLIPVVRKPRARGNGYTKARKIPLKKLYRNPDFDGELLDQDKAVLSHLEQKNHYGYARDEYLFDSTVWTALIGHPRVYLEHDPDTKLDVVGRAPELIVKRIGGGQLTMGFDCEVGDGPGVVMTLEEPQLVITEIEPRHTDIAKVINEGLELPSEAESELSTVLGGLTKAVTIHSEVSMDGHDVATVTADTRIRVRLLPMGDEMQVHVVICPLGEDGPILQPGSGTATVLAEINGNRVTTSRDTAAERELLLQLYEACPTLASAEIALCRFQLEEIDDALEVILELQNLNHDQILVEWPEGEKFHLRGSATTGNLSLRSKSTRNWLAVDGEAQIDGSMVLKLQEFLSILDDSPGRFIQLKDGSYVHITNQLRRILDEFQRVGKTTKDGVQIHPLAVPYADEVLQGVDEFLPSPKWQETLRRIAKVENMAPKLPSTFQGEMRDYQLEGFQWLVRLNELGMGACLADDMGLGKTIQALALLITVAPKGPSMVVAPTSVIQNWQTEAKRFAPTLNPVMMHAQGDRSAILDSLGPYDVLITSYGLMHNELAQLSEITFETIVLDEAQAIKNYQTKRSKAARRLNAKFKMMTTGTPIENHLSELWSLFEFINPGLLGTHPSFNKRFAIPIEKQKDKAVRHSLRRLINPFILRRNKSEILDELPPRTEIELKVTLSKDEQAFYEALRQQAVETVEKKEDNQQLTILAEIMRLRRACCHPRLVNKEIPLQASKLELFLELVDELRENNHRALVFSQFVDHLGFIREALDNAGVTYCYLDGSTPVKQRVKQVELFQAGGRDLFLISLKAGGTGLNLTAADYVIHMDPWWNPAVEDQASDRAHRIGQTRPVTIYRLVTQGTIEEKIVELHRSKRALADKLLAGTDQPTTLSANDLIDLIRRDG